MVERLGKLLPQALRRAGIEQKVAAAQIIDLFKRVIHERWGEAALKRIEPKYVRSGYLTVAVQDAAYRSELKVNEQDILKKLNTSRHKTAVKGLRLI